VAAFDAPPAFGLIFAVILKGKILQTYVKIRKTQTVFVKIKADWDEVL
jgi:hypothetical protein